MVLGCMNAAPNGYHSTGTIGGGWIGTGGANITGGATGPGGRYRLYAISPPRTQSDMNMSEFVRGREKGVPRRSISEDLRPRGALRPPGVVFPCQVPWLAWIAAVVGAVAAIAAVVGAVAAIATAGAHKTVVSFTEVALPPSTPHSSPFDGRWRETVASIWSVGEDGPGLGTELG